MAGFKSSLDAIASKKWGPILGIILAFVIAYLMLVYVSPHICFGILLVAVIIFFIPYYFGLKNFKWLAVWGIVFVLLMPIPYAAAQVDIAYEYDDKGHTASATDGTLVNGIVVPYTDSENGVYVYTVEADPKYSIVSLKLANVYTDNEYSGHLMNKTGELTEDGKEIWTLSLDDLKTGYYAYYFEGAYINEEEKEEKVHTGALNGPITDTKDGLYLQMLKSSLISMALYVGLLYFLLMFMMYTNRRNREMFEQQRAKQSRPQEGPDGTFHCPKCNSEVIKGQKFCPQCGENFAVDPREVQMPSAPFKGADDDYFCTECGTKVDENATVCPGCGKKFE